MIYQVIMWCRHQCRLPEYTTEYNLDFYINLNCIGELVYIYIQTSFSIPSLSCNLSKSIATPLNSRLLPLTEL